MKKKIIIERKVFPIGRVLPAMITLCSTALGMTAILFSMNMLFERAVIAIMLAAILDALDGRVARMFKSTSQFGIELDSLSDSISFGVAPAFILYFFSVYELRAIGWAISIFFAICCVLRLARFNAMSGNEKVPEYWKSFFTGIPAPGGAFLALTPIALFVATDNWFFVNSFFCASVMLVIGFLMVSRVPTLSLKKIKISSSVLLPVLLAVVMVFVLLGFHFWYVLSGISILYVMTVPYTVWKFLKLRKEAI